MAKYFGTYAEFKFTHSLAGFSGLMSSWLRYSLKEKQEDALMALVRASETLLHFAPDGYVAVTSLCRKVKQGFLRR